MKGAGLASGNRRSKPVRACLISFEMTDDANTCAASSSQCGCAASDREAPARVRARYAESARSGCCSGPEVERIVRVLATVDDDSGATNAVLIKLALSEHRETVVAVPNSEPRTRVSGGKD